MLFAKVCSSTMAECDARKAGADLDLVKGGGN